MATVATPSPTEKPKATNSETTRSMPAVVWRVDRAALIAADTAAGDATESTGGLSISGRPAHVLARRDAKTGAWHHIDPEEAAHARRDPVRFQVRQHEAPCRGDA